uniref:Uncharacterized protein n=1 Tax=Oryza rufipogon TaxID=4529 RepID=A0A0E0NVL6_ORYRU
MVVVAARRGASDMAGQGALHPQQQGAQRSRAGNGAAPWWLILLDRPRRSCKSDIEDNYMETPEPGAWTYFGERAKENFCRIMAITNFASNIAKF